MFPRHPERMDRDREFRGIAEPSHPFNRKRGGNRKSPPHARYPFGSQEDMDFHDDHRDGAGGPTQLEWPAAVRVTPNRSAQSISVVDPKLVPVTFPVTQLVGRERSKGDDLKGGLKGEGARGRRKRIPVPAAF